MLNLVFLVQMSPVILIGNFPKFKTCGCCRYLKNVDTRK